MLALRTTLFLAYQDTPSRYLALAGTPAVLHVRGCLQPRLSLTPSDFVSATLQFGVNPSSTHSVQSPLTATHSVQSLLSAEPTAHPSRNEVQSQKQNGWRVYQAG